MASGYLSSAFDLLNVGDLDLITQARARCEHLVVGVHSDQYVERLTGRRPVVPQEERLALVSHISGVDVAVLDDGAERQERGTDRMVFAVGHPDVDQQRAGVYWLAPGRQTQSAALRAALAPCAETGVA